MADKSIQKKIFQCYNKIILSLNILFLIGAPSLGQSLRFEHITTDQGLSQNQVFYLFQDSRGFLWVSTSNGLNRYDGATFKIYHSNPDDSTTIGGNTYKAIIEDEDKNLWIGSSGGGLSKYVRNRDSFIRYVSNKNNPNSPLSDRINALLIDKHGYMWIGTEEGLSRMNINSGKFQHVGVDPNNSDSLGDKRIYSLLEDSDGRIWIGTWRGLYVYDSYKNKFVSYAKNQKKTNYPFSYLINKIYEDKQKNIWICTNRGLYLFNKKNYSFRAFLSDTRNQFSLSDNDVRKILEDKNGNIWIATYSGGLNLFDKSSGKFHHFTNNTNDAYSINNNSLIYIFEDNSGLLWIGTNGGGLNKLNPHTTQFQHFRNTAGTQNTLSQNNVCSFAVDNNDAIWIGTISGGLNKLVRKGNQYTFSHFIYNSANINTISSGPVFSIALDKENNLWIGTETGLNKFSQKENTFKLYNPLKNPTMNNHSVFSVDVDSDNNVWIGTYGGGLSLLKKESDKFINHVHSEKNPESISSNIIRHIMEDSKKRLWVSTENGLNFFDRNSNKFYSFKKSTTDTTSIVDNFVLFTFEDSKNNIWVGTPYGMCKMSDNADPRKIKFTRITKTDGLPGENVQGIEEDDHGNLWISTNNGLSKYDPYRKTFLNFGASDGLQGKEFYVNANVKIRKTGEMIFGGDNGFNIFHPDSISVDKFIPPVVFTEFNLANIPVLVNKEIDGRIILEKSITETDEINLSYKQNDISFEYASLYYVNSSQIKYKYMLEGVDNEWIDAGNRRFIAFVNLPAGDYTLRVIACNHSGVWNTNGATMKIHIHPPFWETWYFRLIILVGLIISLISFYKYKTRSIKSKSRDLQLEVEKQTSELRLAKDIAEAANKSKSDFLANISHELRTPLNAIMGYAQLLRKHSNLNDQQKEQLFTIQKSGEHLLTLINDILEFRKIEVKKEEVHKIEFNLLSLIHEVLGTIRVKAFEKSLDFLFEENANLPSVVIGDSKKIKQILINLLGNGIKYTSEGYVKLNVESSTYEEKGYNTKKQWIKFIVSDTGIGIPKEIAAEIFQPFGPGERSRINVEGSGLGLAISKRLAELMGGSLSVVSEEGYGSIFTFELAMEVVEKKLAEDPKENELVIGYEGERKCLMIIDDNFTNRSMLSSYFEPLGFIIEIAEDGQTALEKLKQVTPELILLDFLMPIMDGNKFIREFRRNSEYAKIKLIGISAAVADKERMDIFYAKCDDFVSKPVSLPVLLEKISRLLQIKLIREKGNSTQSSKRTYDISQITIPNYSVTKEIIEAINIGNYSGLEKIIQRLESENDSLKPFCEKIREYSQTYDDEAIINLCDKHS